MNKHQIIIVTEELDSHADDMVVCLERMGKEPIRLHPQDFPQQALMALSLEGKDWAGTITIQSSGRVIHLEEIRSIWWRRPTSPEPPATLSKQEREFARQEIGHALSGLWESLDCYWVSYPTYIRQAAFKGGQLRRAAQFGFEVPRTIITSDPEQVHAFYDLCRGEIIYKVMSDPFLASSAVNPRHTSKSVIDANNLPSAEPQPTFGTYTTRVTEKELALLDSIRFAPCQFQEYIPKQLELRVTVIGNEVFAAEIHSQAHERTSVDWRHYDVDIPYCKATLPQDIAERCLAFAQSYHLNYSAMDLILTPDSRYVFIENNPNGQFMFIEKVVPELRMTEALAACLIRGAN